MDRFSEFIKLPPDQSDAVFEYYVDLLNSIQEKQYPVELTSKLGAASSKLIEVVGYNFGIEEKEKKEFLDSVHELHLISGELLRINSELSLFPFDFELFLFRKRRQKTSLQIEVHNSYGKVFQKAGALISRSMNYNGFYNELKLNGFYSPDNSNKQRIKRLIEEAIDLITKDYALSEESKLSIITHLEAVLKELEKPRINWTNVIGKVKETVIVLGALGSFAGGLASLSDAIIKLEEVSAVIQTTSITIDYNIFSKTLNIDSIEEFKKNSLLKEWQDSHANIDSESNAKIR